MDFFQCCRSPKRVEEEENRSEEGVGKFKRKVPASSIPVTISIPDCLPALDGSDLLGNSDSKKEDSVEEGDMTQIATLWGNSDSKEEDPVQKLIDYYVHDTKPWVTFDSENEDPVEKGGDKAHTGALSFNLWELAAVTNDFSLESLVGLGNYGRVYKGMPQDGQTNLPSQIVAVKQLDRDGIQGEEELTANFLALGHLNHPNLVDLIGYCTDGDQRLLVYEFMPLGSLEDHLHDLPPNKEPLDWNTRMKIAAGVARGLEYLHNQINPPVIYRFMKSSNILLGEGYHPKLADVGLERFFPTRAKTAYGYCAPEDIVMGNLTVKSDVYSFGVLLLELITGRKAVDNNRCDAEQLLVTWAGLLLSCETKFKFSSMADPLLQGRFPWMSLHEALCLVEQCLHVKEEYRPSIENIVAKVSSLASQTYDPKTGAAQSVVTRHRACKHQCFTCSSTPKPTEDDRNIAGVSQDRRGSKFSYNVGSTVGKVNGTSSWKGKGILLH